LLGEIGVGEKEVKAGGFRKWTFPRKLTSTKGRKSGLLKRHARRKRARGRGMEEKMAEVERAACSFGARKGAN